MLEYTLYVDVWLLRLGCNFIFEYLLLWATATITRTQTTPMRLLMGSFIGTLHYLLYLAASVGMIPFYGLLRFLPIVILVSAAMICAAFFPISWRRLVIASGYFYTIGFVAAGMGLAAAYLLGSPDSPAFTTGTLISILAILLIAELGWGIVHERVVHTIYRVPVEISCDGQSIKMTALVDTGNQLKDPLNRQSVIIVDWQSVKAMLPSDVASVMVSLEEGDPAALNRFTELETWRTRLRLIPFNSIGKTNGLMLGFRPDEVRIGAHTWTGDIQPTVAVHPHNLDPNGEYNALVPPHLVDNSLQTVEGGEAYAKASSDFQS
ncbi:MAG TPA: sigma-E processing peptidase SpoIIGA [Firmicutes bacterium]|jgi:stage II sporulation protein GA (sporulation sigma-E factor processing peptidase)|nr:sigma-E processing peptidase SpoIIGA [Bacillota bacterium]HHT42599.1 sigma-E processing peptidase SpoIIGA [Bacillota bacterium]